MAPRKTPKKYSDTELLQAVAACKTKTLTPNEASIKYCIPVTTLKDRLSGKYTAKILQPGLSSLL